MPSDDYYELRDLDDEGYEELVELATLCIVTKTPYSEARLWPDVLRAAFTEAYNRIHGKD